MGVTKRCMNLTLPIPDDLAERLGANGADLTRRALEALAVEEYRAGHLTDADLCRMLGLSAGDDLLLFLRAHGLSGAASLAFGARIEGRPGPDREAARAAAQRIRAMRKGVTLGGVCIKDLINEGRR